MRPACVCQAPRPPRVILPGCRRVAARRSNESGRAGASAHPGDLRFPPRGSARWAAVHARVRPGGAHGRPRRAVLTYTAAECTNLGCTNLLRWLVHLATPGRPGVEPGAHRKHRDGGAQFRRLDRPNGRFPIGSTVNSGAASMLRKILAVAKEPLSVDELAETLACDTRLLRSGVRDPPARGPGHRRTGARRARRAAKR